jgi:hypothetical protein
VQGVHGFLAGLFCLLEGERDRGAEELEYLPLGLGRDGELVEGGGAGVDGVAGQGGQVGEQP